MKIDFGQFETAKTPAPVDYAMLCATLTASQACSPTAKLAMIADERRVFRPMSQSEHAIILFRNEQGWQLSPDAMHGSFHAAAAKQLLDKAL